MQKLAFALVTVVAMSCQHKDSKRNPNAEPDDTKPKITDQDRNDDPCSTVSADWREALRGKKNNAFLAKILAETDENEREKLLNEYRDKVNSCRL